MKTLRTTSKSSLICIEPKTEPATVSLEEKKNSPKRQQLHPVYVYALQWQALHMAAAAACRGSTPKGGHGCCENAVLPSGKQTSCQIVCGRRSYKHCDAEVALAGFRGKAKTPTSTVAIYFNYYCGHVAYPNTEPEMKENHLWDQRSFISYCCCRR